jgi:hypothetical protein
MAENAGKICYAIVTKETNVLCEYTHEGINGFYHSMGSEFSV